VLPLVLFAGVVSGAIAPVLVTKGIRRTTRVRAGILGLTEPIVGVTAAAILVGEVLAPIQLVGGAFVLAGALLSQRASDRPPREADAAPASAPPPQLATDLSTAE
jgi:drug/metabolite transporter (DMT)-like permease